MTTWDPDNAFDGPFPKRESPRVVVDIDEIDDGRCKVSSWRAVPPKRATYEGHFGPGGFNRCVGHQGHANPLHKDEWGNVFALEPFRVVRKEIPGSPLDSKDS